MFNFHTVKMMGTFLDQTGHSQPKLPLKQHNMASNCKGLYGIFYKASILNKNGLLHSIGVLFAQVWLF